jgi:hypothetical protein
VGTTAGVLLALDASNGQRVFEHEVGVPVWTAPSIRPDGSLVIGDRNGRVMLLGAG